MADEQLNQTKIGNPKNIVKPIKNDKINNEFPVKQKEEKKNEVKKEEKKDNKKKEIKKTEAVVNAKNVRVSLKHAKAIGRMIKNMKINEAISNLELIVKKKMAVPITGEIPHRKGKKLNGKRIMSGRYPIKAAKEFILLLKSLNSNCISNGLGLEKTIIFNITPNKAPVRMHRFGRTKFKNIHITIKAKEVEVKNK
jgi:ribosomal protein L22